MSIRYPLYNMPRGTRLILAADNLLDQWGTRTEDGYRISVKWGEQKPEGWFEPTFTIDYTDRLPVVEHAPDLGDAA